jgi:hypothetical protein
MHKLHRAAFDGRFWHGGDPGGGLYWYPSFTCFGILLVLCDFVQKIFLFTFCLPSWYLKQFGLFVWCGLPSLGVRTREVYLDVASSFFFTFAGQNYGIYVADAACGDAEERAES